MKDGKHKTMKLMRPSTLTAVALAGTLAMAARAGAQGQHFGSQTTVLSGTGAQGYNAIAIDSSGNFYITDNADNVVYKATLSGGTYTQTVLVPNGYSVSTGVKNPYGITVDSSGDVFIADPGNERVVKETPAGGGTYTQSVVMQSTSGNFINPVGIAVDSNGNVFVTAQSYNFTTLTYQYHLFEFSPSGGTYAESILTVAGLGIPEGLAIDSSNNLYILDDNYPRVTKGTAAGGVYTQTAVVVDDSTFNWLDNPYWIAVDNNGDVFAANSSNSGYNADTIIESLPVGGVYVHRVFGGGFSSSASPSDVTTDTSGNVYVAVNTLGTAEVLKISSPSTNLGSVNVGSSSAVFTMPFTFSTTTTAPQTGSAYSQGATGEFVDSGTGTCDTGGNATYAAGTGCTVNVTFNPKFAGTRQGVVEVVNTSGIMIAEQFLTGIGLAPQKSFSPATVTTFGTLSSPTGVAVDGKGVVYVADGGTNLIYTETPSGSTYTQAQLATNQSGLGQVYGVAIDGADNVSFGYTSGGASYVVQVQPNIPVGYNGGFVANNGEGSALNIPKGIAADGAGNIYIVDSANNRVVEALYSSGSTFNQPSTWQINVATGLSAPTAVAVDLNGNVYIADTGNNRVVKEAPAAGGLFTQTVAVSTGLSAPAGVAVDNIGNLYISDTGNKRVLKETVSGATYTQSVVLSTGLGSPQGLALDSSSNLYIADSTNKVIVKVAQGSAPSLTFASTAVGSTSSDSPQTVTLSNVGNTALNFPIPGTGNNPSISTNFTLSSSGGATCPLISSTAGSAGTLAANASCALPISFVPTTTGSLSGSLVLTDNTLNVAGSTQSVLLNGTGTPAAMPQATLTPNPVTFPLQIAGTTSTQPVTLSNPGTGTLAIMAIAITGTNASLFSQTNNCGTSLTAGSSCTITVTFAPVGGGSSTASLSVTDNATGSPQSTTLNGAASAVVNSSNLFFNPAPVAEPLASAQTLTATFTLTGFTTLLTPTAAMHYGLAYSVGTVSCTGSAGNQTCNVPVTFLPNYPGGRRDALFLMNGSTRLATMLAYGVGTGPMALFQPGSSVNQYNSTGGGSNSYFYQSVTDENGTVWSVGSNVNSLTSLTKAGVFTVIPITGFSTPETIAIDGAGVLYIANNNGSHTSLITYDTVQGTQGSFALPAGSVDITTVGVGNEGNIYGVDTNNDILYIIKPNGTVVNVPLVNSSTNQADTPLALVVDSNENLFFGGYSTTNEYSSSGVQSTINTASTKYGIGIDPAETVYGAEYGAGVVELPASNYASSIYTLNGTIYPFGISIGPDGTANVGDYFSLIQYIRSAGSITFGDTAVGSTTAAQTVGLYNGGNTTLAISNIVLSGAAFTLGAGPINNCTNTTTLAPGTFCEVSVSFTSPHGGTFTGSITFTSNSLNNPSSKQVTSLSAVSSGVYLVATPNPLNFASQLVNTTSGAQSVTITNQGYNYSATFGTLASSSTAFTPTAGTCTTPLAVGSSCNLSVTFTPMLAQAYTGTITIPTTISGGSAGASGTFTVNGAGIPAPAPVAGLSPSTVPFANTPVGSTTTAQNITLSNTGNAALTISSVTLGGTNPSDFTISSNNCGSSLAAFSNCTIAVTFTPASATSFSATLSVADNATGSPQSVSLTGTGTVPVAGLSPSTVPFANTAVGTTTTAQNITLSNTGGAALTISSITLGGANPTDFAISANTCGTTLPAAGTCTISVTFTPASAATFAATVSVADNAAGSPQTATLTGTGTSAVSNFSLTASPQTLTVVGGALAQFTITASGVGVSFTNPIALSVSGLPAGVTSSFAPSSVTPGSSGATSTLSIQTLPDYVLSRPEERPGMSKSSTLFALLLLTPLLGVRRIRKRLARLPRIMVALLLMASFGVLALAGCGGGYFAPQPHTYTLTITGQSGTTFNTTNVSLTVQ